MSKYKLLESVGLPIYKGHIRWTDRDGAGETSNDDWVRAYDLERALSEAPVVSCELYGTGTKPCGMSAHGDNKFATHTFRAVCFEPIVRDSYEQIARDLVEVADSIQQNNPQMSVGYFVERARKLMEGK